MTALLRLAKSKKGLFLGIAAACVLAASFAARSIGALSPKADSPALVSPVSLAASAPLHPVHIRRPEGPPKVFTGETNIFGQPISVSCGTCHSTTTPNRALRDSAGLKEFHMGLKYQHGQLSCLSCHNSDNYDTLRLADGATVAFPDVMQLCGQCHGPQTRDYRNGSHGGMTGYWDLTKGPRHRNTCTDCHDPHWPEYQAVTPVFSPRDRKPSERSPHSPH